MVRTEHAGAADQHARRQPCDHAAAAADRHRRRLPRRRRRRVFRRRRKAKGSLQGLFSTDDYPQSAICERGAGHDVPLRLTIGTDGRVTDCSVTKSSGSGALDSATCSIIQAPRALHAGNGPGRQSDYRTRYAQRIRWQLPDQ